MVVPARNSVANVILQSTPHHWVFETFEHFAGATLVGPGRNDAREVVVAASVRVDVGLNIDAAFAGRPDEGDHLVHSSPQFLIGDLEVDDIDGHTSPFANG